MNSMKPTGFAAIDDNFQKLVSDIVTATLAASAAASAASIAQDTAKKADLASFQATTAAVTASLAAANASHKGGNWSAISLVWNGFAASIDLSFYGNGLYMVATSKLDGTPFTQKMVLITPYASGASTEISEGLVTAPTGAFVSNVYKIAG